MDAEKLLKQVIAHGGNEFQIGGMISDISNLETGIFAYAETWVRMTDDPHRIIEEEQPWKIFIRENPEPFGFLIIKGYEIGVLITYGVFREESWTIVDEFIEILFDQMTKEGFEFHPHKGSPIEVLPKKLVIEYQKAKSLSSEDIAHFDIGEQTEDSECEELLPKKQSTRYRWKQAYQVIVSMRDEYAKLYQDNAAENPKLMIQDYQQGIFNEIRWKPGERTIFKIIKAGDGGCLD